MLSPRLVSVVLLVATAVIGLVRLKQYSRKLKEGEDFLLEFGKHFKRFVESHGRDFDAYAWLTSNAAKMQMALGPLGVMALQQQSGYLVTNFQILINLLPEIRDDFLNDMPFLFPQLATQKVNTVQDALIRYGGMLDQLRNEVTKEQRNPFVWLKEGVRILLIAPVAILQFFGLVPERAPQVVGRTAAFRVVAGAVALLGLLATIITIVVGWTAFVAVIHRLLGV